MSGTRPDTVHGKIFENMIKGVFSDVEKRMPCKLTKITDSHSAGNLIDVVSGDFELLVPRVWPESVKFIIECKASKVESTLQGCFRSFIKPGPLGKVRKEKRAGAVPIVMFYSLEREEIEIWDYVPIYEVHAIKREPIPDFPLAIVSKTNLLTMAEKVVSSQGRWITDKIRYIPAAKLERGTK